MAAGTTLSYLSLRLKIQGRAWTWDADYFYFQGLSYLATCSSFLVCDTKNQLTLSFTWNARLSNSTKEWQNQGCYFNNLSDSLKFCESGPGASQHSHSDTQTGDISRFVNTFTIHMWWEKCTVSFCRNQQKGSTDSSSDPIMIYDFAVINNSGQSVLKPQLNLKIFFCSSVFNLTS